MKILYEIERTQLTSTVLAQCEFCGNTAQCELEFDKTITECPTCTHEQTISREYARSYMDDRHIKYMHCEKCGLNSDGDKAQ